MVFSSLEFVFVFLPIFLLLYYATPYKYKNHILFLGSLYFYAVGEPVYIILIIFFLVINYIVSKWIKGKFAMFWLIIALLFNVSILAVFKYADFLINNVNQMTGMQIPLLKLALPIGISFYTFQIISYVVDVYRGKVKRDTSFVKFSTYITMFPQLIAGPIVLYNDIAEEMTKRKITLHEVEAGLKFFILGLASKVLIANKMGLLWNEIQKIGFESISTPLAWLGAFAFSIQIYFDFNGYSLMAIGLGKFLGFTIPENFRQPYAAKSLTEFWQRWHITLGRWFKEYIYIPLGGNRKGKARHIANLLCIWFLTGLWHGAAWNFVLWGMTTCFFIILEKLLFKKLLDKTYILSRLYMLILLPATWMMFAIEEGKELITYLKVMFPFSKEGFVLYQNPLDFIKYLSIFGPIMGIGILLSTPIGTNIYHKKQNRWWILVLLLVLFWLSVYELANAVNNPFLYFRF